MAKHSKKKIIFNFVDISRAEEFMELIGRKKMYANTSLKLNPTGKLELTLTGSPENIKTTIFKLKRLHETLLPKLKPNKLSSKRDEEEIELRLKLKKLKFEES
jgi:hypothetical protein